MAHIKNDKENQVDTIQQDKDPEKPPVGAAWEQKREAATRMVKEKLEFFPYAAAVRHAF